MVLYSLTQVVPVHLLADRLKYADLEVIEPPHLVLAAVAAEGVTTYEIGAALWSTAFADFVHSCLTLMTTSKAGEKVSTVAALRSTWISLGCPLVSNFVIQTV